MFHFFQEQGKYGLRDDSGTVVVPCQWDFYTQSFPESDLYKIAKNGKFGILTASRELVHDCIFEDIELFYFEEWDASLGCVWDHYYGHNAFAVKQNGKWGYISRDDGSWISQCQWDTSECFCGKHLRARVCRDGKWGILAPDGHLITPCQWEEMGSLDSFTPVKKDGKWSYIDTEGHVLFPGQLDYATSFDYWFCNGELAAFLLDGTLRYLGQDGTLHLPSAVHARSHECHWFWRKGKYCLCYTDPESLRGTLQERFYPQYDLVAVCVEGRYGLFRMDGSPVYPCCLEWLCPFFSGTAIARKNGKWGVVDMQGQLVLPFRWDYVTHFQKNDLALVRTGEHWGIVSRSCEELHPCTLTHGEAARLRDKLLKEKTR